MASARATGFVVRDRLFNAPRNAILRALPDGNLIAYLIVCARCVSVYTGAAGAILGSVLGWWPWEWTIPVALATSQANILMASREGDE